MRFSPSFAQENRKSEKMWITFENRKKCERKSKMSVLTENYDVAIVGAGHAGCEAALACARLGLETIMFTVSVDRHCFDAL